MSIVLKPCPFCGGDASWAYVVDNNGVWNGVWVGCKDNDNYSEEPKCRIRPFIKRCRENKEESLEIAIKDWNNRPNPWQASTKSEDELIDAIIEQNGIQAQTIQLGEEMGELFTAVSHRLRNRTTSNEHIKEEVADVMFMLRQLIRFFDLDKQEVEEVIEQKKQRMRERIKNRKGE
jgi:NTP pyrophosphatase (non-canonical NTP hydrolase)